MKKLVFSLVVALMFSTTAMAIDIAISSQGGWMGQGHADTEAQEIVDNVTGVSVSLFTPSDLDALADWVADHTGNGQSDLLVMFGIFPATIYAAGNGEPDGSLAEAFLDDGNCIINTGDYIFYVGSAGNNDAGGLENMLDVPGAGMWGDDSGATTFAPTADGKLYTPSLPELPSNRPWIPAQFDGTDWEFELVLAQSADGTQAHPAILKNRVTGGRVGVFFQWSDDTQPRGEVISEWINNWYLLNVSPPGQARNPIPAAGAVDVLRDGALSWTPGQYPGTHNVYLGESPEDVNDATAPTAANLTDASFDHGRLEFGKTYYWRVDEVNVSPDKTVFPGKIWSFQVEPYAIQIPESSIVVTASSAANEFSVPENTINGSGLGADNTHSISSEAMWFTGPVDLDPWIQYEFDAVQKLDVMRVWNSNSAAEMAIGWGVKDVEIVYSVDGENWDVLEGATQFSRGTSAPTYNTYDTIAFGGVPAKFVRLNIASNWGGILMSYSLSEVQFDMIPAAARTPDPADGATDVLPNAVVAWRAGREASQHTIYVGTDQTEVADGLAPSLTSSTNSVDLSSLDLDMGTVYYWRVDEVNEAEAVSTWTGPVWSFMTAAALIVEDFERYNNISPNRPFQSWLDGFGYSADEFFPVAYPGNGTGAGIGHDIWSLSSPYYDGDIMETSSTIAGSGQSLPFYYTNSGGTVSETERTFATPQDWTVGAAQTLSIAFRGTAGNTGSLYVKINGVKLTYPRAASNIAFGTWQAWNIDLSTVNTNLQSITKMAFGVDGSGASGMILIDDITLHASPGELITPADPGTNGLVALYNFEGNFNDSSGNGHTGTVVGIDGTAVVSDPERGQVLGLPGGDDQYVSIGAVGISGTMPRTIGCWAKAANTNIPDWTLIFGFTGKTVEDGSGGNGSHFNIGSLGGPGGIGAHCWGWEETMVSDQEGLNWHHYAMTYDGTTIAYFLDGLAMDSDPGKSNVQDLSTSGDRVHIGSRVTQTSSFPGSVDDAVIYDRVLSAEEILWIAGRTSPVDKPF